MPNVIELAKAYVPLLDEVYQMASVTSVLDGASELMQPGANANEIVIPKISMDGLGDYSRNSGYVNGDVTLTNETVRCNFDRGRMFNVDVMDDLESAGIAFGRLSGEFIRTKVAPEIDAFRFATYCGIPGIGSDSGDLTTGANIITALRKAAQAMDNAEVPADQRYLFLTPYLYGLIQDMDTTKSRAVISEFAGVIKVPQTRFYTAIEQRDGSSNGQTSGGYAKRTTATYAVTTSQPADWSTNYANYYTKSGSNYTAVTGNSAPSWAAATYYRKTADAAKNLNFMVVHKPAVIQFEKHVAPKIITPEQNQSADGYKFGYRNVGIADAYENKAAGIYIHCATT